jgi:hypothetical protein
MTYIFPPRVKIFINARQEEPVCRTHGSLMKKRPALVRERLGSLVVPALLNASAHHKELHRTENRRIE